jgi:hypothetical protein
MRQLSQREVYEFLRFVSITNHPDLPEDKAFRIAAQTAVRNTWYYYNHQHRLPIAQGVRL